MAGKGAEVKSGTPVVPPHIQPLVDGYKQLYKSNYFTDLTVTCKDREWNIHKAVAYGQSAFFQKALTGNYTEAKSNQVLLKDDDANLVDAMVHFFYNFDYPESDEEQTGIPPIVQDVRMYAIADKYFVRALQKVAQQKFEARIAKEWDTPAFAQAVGEAYAAIPGEDDALKRIIVLAVFKHRGSLLDKAKSHDEFIKMLRATPDLGTDLCIAQSPIRFQCSSCEIIFSVCAIELDWTHDASPWLRCNCYGPMVLEWWRGHKLKD